MDKPITVVYEDLKQDIIALINNSKLPAIMIEHILQNLLSETSIAVQRQYQYDKSQYEGYLVKETLNETNMDIKK